jgi:hypothetical protein
MTAWITGIAIFYTFAIAYLGYEMRRAPLIDENGNVLSDANRALEALHTMRLRQRRAETISADRAHVKVSIAERS